MDRVRLRRLQKLSRQRFGNHHLPDDSDGRAMLVALLRFGLSDETAIADAPWCEAELPAFKRRAKRIKWHEVSELIGLRFAERNAVKLFNIGKPLDVSVAEIDAWRKDRKRESSRKSKAKQRAKERRMKEAMKARARKQTMTPRQAAVLEILIERGDTRGDAMPVPELMAAVSKHHAFTRARYRNVTWGNGPPARVMVSNLRTIVHRTLDQLEGKGAVESYKLPGEHGPVRLAMVRNQASKTSITASHPALFGKASKIKDLTKRGGCPLPTKSLGGGHASDNTTAPFSSKPEASTSPAASSKGPVSNATRNNVILLHPRNRVRGAA
jgi:hypothetical protein